MLRRTRERSIELALVTLLAATAGCGGGTAKLPAPELEPTQKMRMAQSLMKAGRVGEALTELDEAVAAEPDNAGLRLYYGQICFDGGLYEQAERALSKALEIDPYMTDAYILLGAAYQELERPNDAEAAYRKALENQAYPSPEKAYLGLGILYAGQRRDEEAIDNLRQAVGINPKYYTAHFELASILDRIGRLAEAVREYEVAEPGYRNSGDYLYRTGFAYFRLGDAQRARECLTRVIEIAPGSKSAEQADQLLQMME